MGPTVLQCEAGPQRWALAHRAHPMSSSAPVRRPGDATSPIVCRCVSFTANPLKVECARIPCQVSLFETPRLPGAISVGSVTEPHRPVAQWVRHAMQGLSQGGRDGVGQGGVRQGRVGEVGVGRAGVAQSQLGLSRARIQG